MINVISAVAQGEFECLVGRREREHSGKGGVGGGGRQKAGQRRCVMLVGTEPVYTVQTVKEKKKERRAE